jgi:cell division protein FtsZ
MTVTILSALQGEAPAVVEVRPRANTRTESSPSSIPPTAPSTPPRVSEPAPVLRVVEKAPEPIFLEPVAARAASVEAVTAVAEVQESAELIETESARVTAVAAKAAARTKAVQAKQEQMQFEPVTRGRFEKSEPTIVDGQDLDVPTFLRRNVKVK